MAGVLVLCALLLSCQVMCQDDTAEPPTDAPAADASAATGAADSGDASGTTAAADATAAPTAAAGGDSDDSAAPGDSFLATLMNITRTPDVQDADTLVVTAAPADVVPEIPAVTDKVVKTVVPDVTCVGEDHQPETNAIKAVVDTKDCETTKEIIQKYPAAWCNKETCQLEIFQDGNKVSVASADADKNTLHSALHSKDLKEKLGLPETKSSNYSVFWGTFITGLLAALAITLGYFKCQRRPDTKGVKLAEEAYPVDQENQGNTLVSVAPLNPPPETPEKPSVNGESPEAAKTQPPPPTNGHSTTKTADTEL